MMRFRFFSISIVNDEQAIDELNQFLSSHRVVEVDRQFVSDGANSRWAFCVSYLSATPTQRKGRVDYRDVLPQAEFAVFVKLRNLRKQLSENEGVPAFALFTNEQLAQMIQHRITSVAQLRDIEGVGDARISKYGQAFLEILKVHIPDLDKPTPDGTTVETHSDNA